MASFGFRRKRRPTRDLPPAEHADFIAFDVETANSSRASICAIGIAIVNHGEITYVGSTLINPECDFNGYNIAVNGISPADVQDAPTLPQAWPEIRSLLDGQRMIAHYASFDVGALRSAAARYGLIGPTLELYCTYRLARRAWPELPSHGLGFLGPTLGIQFDHHEAGADAFACASIALLACRQVGVSSIVDLAANLHFVAGQLTPDSYTPASVLGTSKSLKSRDGNVDADPDHPLYGKSLCFTGGMFAMPRSEAADLVVGLGGNFKTNVSKKTDYLVIGDADFVQFADGWRTGKLKRAMELRDEDAPIEIIAERDFLAMLYS